MKRMLLIISVLMVCIGALHSLSFFYKGLLMTNTLRVAFPKGFPARQYEPTRIHLAPEYIFLENIYSPLVELSPEDATVRSGVAEKWEWKNDELHFSIRNDLMTIDGKKITAEDAAFSLKRLLVRTQNTHGNLKDLVCGGTEVKTIEDSCEGISYKDNELILKIAGKSAFILPMLSGIDFAIIPKSSVDPKTLDIIDYRNTSGPYYVSKDSETGEIELSANNRHYHYSGKIPQKIQLVPVDPKDKSGSLQLFLDNKVDFITTIDSARSEEVYKLSQKVSTSNFHSTANIRTFALFFSERGIRDLSVDERMAIGKKIKLSISEYFLKLPGYEDVFQFFPQHGDGAIANDQAKSIFEKAAFVPGIESKKVSIEIVRVGKLDIYQNRIKAVLPNVEVTEGSTLPSFRTYNSIDEMPHAHISGPDTGFNEDISLISYSLTAGFFGLSQQERQTWLAAYMSKPDKKHRLKMLQEIHESSLKKALLIPLFASPYTALARSGWKIHLSKILANNPLWLITKD
jgi:MarR-like DNA-binding transcriptional regulator SgrR of sgrS sRNA